MQENTAKICSVLPVFVILLLFPLLFLACEAPRNNPLDPENPVNLSLATLEGTVQTISLPYATIDSVMVLWLPGNKIVYTDDRGGFVITGIKPVDGLLIFEKEGFNPDTLNIKWEGQKKIARQVSLNKLPDVDSLSIYTVVKNQVNSGLNFELDVVVKIIDKDNAIDSVFVENSDLGIKKALNYDVINKIYQLTLTASELKVDDLEKIIGYEFNVIAKDKLFQKEISIGSKTITRVIKNTINILSPSNGQFVSSSPQLNWERYNAGYNFSYTIEIFTNDLANPQLIKRITNISANTTTYQVTENLSKREYYWVAWIVDNYNNMSRSKPAVFAVP